MIVEILVAPGMVVSVEPISPGLLLQAGSRYGFWEPIISILQGVGLAASGVGLVIAILIKGIAGTNSERHARAFAIAERAFAGLFLVLLGWFIYDRIVEWTPL